MQHSREQSHPKPATELKHTYMHPHEAMAHIKKKYPKLKPDQYEQIHERMMYYAHGTPNGVTHHVMETVEHHARRYHEMNQGREKLPYGDTVHKGRTKQ